MRISCRWLSKYLDLPELDKVVQTLTFSGIEVEGVEMLNALPDSVVTARVISAERIEGTDHLQVCSVDYGSPEPIQVVCGAPNCHAGMVTVLALPGTNLKDMEIKKAKLKGVESSGMLCSERELRVSDNHAGIIELDPQTPIGTTVNELYELPDTILELEITPNRSDLLGYIGIARDLSASLEIPLKWPEPKSNRSSGAPDVTLTLVLQNTEKCPRYTARIIDGVTIKDSPQWLKTALVKSGLRPINNIVDITNFVMLETGQPLHAFDYHKLQPAAPEDAYPSIVVRSARNGEEFIALDGKTYLLDGQDLVISDGQNASALAGVIGGKNSSISVMTKTIVLESAAFNPQSIRATAYKYKISTDSSYRFERHLSEASPDRASQRAVELILEVAGGRVCNELYDAYPRPLEAQYLALRPRRFTELIGYELDEDLIKKYLEALGCRFIQYGTWQEESVSDLSLVHCHHSDEMAAGKTEFSEVDCDHALYFQIPPYRVDLTREADLLEELARLAGYDRIPQKKAISQIMDRHAHKLTRCILDNFVNAGFYEVMNYSFCDPVQLAELGIGPEELDIQVMRLVNPQSINQSALRISLLPQLLANLSYNLNHGERNLKIMEMAKLYLRNGDTYTEPVHLTALITGKMISENWKDESEAVNIYQVKGIIESMLNNMGIKTSDARSLNKPWLVDSDNLAFYSGEALCASIGRLKSDIAETFGIDIPILKQDIWVLDVEVESIVELTRNCPTEFKTLPRHPAVIRDVSFVIDQTIAYSQIEVAIETVDPEMISQVSIFDEYRGKQVPEGFRSLSLHILMQDSEKTLTDERVDQLIASVLKMLESTWHIIMR